LIQEKFAKFAWKEMDGIVVMSRYWLLLKIYKCASVLILYLQAKLPPPAVIIGQVVAERYIYVA
jgi:hypothetical protein